MVGQRHVMVKDPFEIVDHLMGELHRDTGFDQSQPQGVLPEVGELLIRPEPGKFLK